MTFQASLEALMLLCFGLAWPVANLRMLRTRCPEGKGLAFTLIILMGYVAGALAKWPSVSGLDSLPGVFWLYLANGSSVALNLFLQWYFRQAKAAAPSPQPGPGLIPGGPLPAHLAAAATVLRARSQEPSTRLFPSGSFRAFRVDPGARFQMRESRSDTGPLNRP